MKILGLVGCYVSNLYLKYFTIIYSDFVEIDSNVNAKNKKMELLTGLQIKINPTTSVSQDSYRSDEKNPDFPTFSR